jgi:hypothetical protein
LRGEGGAELGVKIQELKADLIFTFEKLKPFADRKEVKR